MRARFEKSPAEVRQPHRYTWLWEPLESEATFVLRSMFGAKAAYLVSVVSGASRRWHGI